MSKRLNIGLNVTANTKQAQEAIQNLSNKLSILNRTIAENANSGKLPITNKLIEASSTANRLNTILQQSLNVDTGNLDLSKFNESMKKAGLNATTLKNQMVSLGPQGKAAFIDLTNSVLQAEVPLKRVSKLANELWNTFKNTVRWQITSSALHTLSSGISEAFYYARSLDKSLTNIRIVTGYSAEEMSKFAQQANKAAKALSTTTTQYTDASLIYFQQGLSDDEVQRRADITIKMAHASGQTAQVVSDQLTAIWNNYSTGADNLERYADVLTALGAATASSSDEIAGGLEKFSSIANMIGLSYDYAASALATITAITRQSEDVVGTALKTIFARIQGLSLGDTLEDGTDLNKYSRALDAVGISIKDQNGNLKEMDAILDEMGDKWVLLTKDQQVALAQTVAGKQSLMLALNFSNCGKLLRALITKILW